MLRKQLKSLPATLPQTYERILLNIEESYSPYVLKMLQWLTYSKQPLSLLQLAEVVAIDEDEDPRFDPERRFPDPEDILLMCSSLVTATDAEEYPWEDDALEEDPWENDASEDDASEDDYGQRKVVKVKLAHFSVKEYLVSSQIMDGGARKYSVQEIDANVRIARDCLSYILYFTEDIPEPASHEEDKFWSGFPLAQYAADEWQKHARVDGRINEESMVDLIMELFTPEGTAYSPWYLAKLFQQEGRETPLHYASETGLLGVARRLITMGVDVDAHSGPDGNALAVASAYGRTEMVKLLLEMGSDPNESKNGWRYGSPVYQASEGGHGEIVRMLLDAGAKVGLEEYAYYISALHAAADYGHADIVAMLINSGVDVNLNTGNPSDFKINALAFASTQANDKVAKLLVEAGADPESKSWGLHIASRYGRNEVVKVLLGAGANPNQGWELAGPLRAAVKYYHLTTAKILLDAGADVNLGGTWNENSFHSVVRLERRQQMLELLVAAGAKITGVEAMMEKDSEEINFEKELEHEGL